MLNKKKIGKIIETLELKPGDVVIEIGPGKGALTIPLAEQCQELGCKIIAIEKDKELAENLVRQSADENVEIIFGDVLKIISQLITNHYSLITNYKIVGNIPYYITGYLLRILGELENKPSLIVLTIQKEVAQRICANPPKMNLLAASVQFWAEPKIIGYIPKKDFRPAPKVDSAIIRLIVNSEKEIVNSEKYYKFIKILFKQPRKTILNNLRPMTNDQRLLKEKLEKFGINPQARPQNLSIEQIIELSTLF